MSSIYLKSKLKFCSVSHCTSQCGIGSKWAPKLVSPRGIWGLFSFLIFIETLDNYIRDKLI